MIKTLIALFFCFQIYGGAELSYASLAMTDKEKEGVREIVTILGKPRWAKYLYLAAKTFYLREKGDEVDNVHPLRFIGFICADPKLRGYLANIKEDSWIWPQFIGPLGEALHKKAQKNELDPFLSGFSEELHVEPSRVKTYIFDKNFDGLVDYLLGKAQ